jgi:hypothetical protein
MLKRLFIALWARIYLLSSTRPQTDDVNFFVATQMHAARAVSFVKLSTLFVSHAPNVSITVMPSTTTVPHAARSRRRRTILLRPASRGSPSVRRSWTRGSAAPSSRFDSASAMTSPGCTSGRWLSSGPARMLWRTNAPRPGSFGCGRACGRRPISTRWRRRVRTGSRATRRSRGTAPCSTSTPRTRWGTAKAPRSVCLQPRKPGPRNVAPTGPKEPCRVVQTRASGPGQRPACGGGMAHGAGRGNLRQTSVLRQNVAK